jgi:hypothetical protein
MRTDRLLATYLNDHLAGATGGLELARRAAGSNRGTAYGPPLERLGEEIGEDREALQEIMERLGVGRDRLKIALSWGAEEAGRLKLNGRLFGYSPLSRLEELELLSLGVEGKLSLWRALDRTIGGDPRLAGVGLEALIGRARSQRRRLETLRLKAADEALVSPPRSGV